MTGIATKSTAGISLISGGGFLGLVMFLQGAKNYTPPPPGMSFIQWVDHFSSGLGALTSIVMGISGIIFLVLKYIETKRHNKAMEPNNGNEDKAE